MALIRQKNDSWITEKVKIINEDTKVEKKYTVLRDSSGSIMTKNQWEKFKKEIDILYKDIGSNKLILTNEISKTKDNYKNKIIKPRKIKGFVYLLQADNGFIKIGRTINVKNRMRMLSVQLPYKTKILGVIETDDCVGLEEKLHLEYKDKRVNGEWFRLTKDEIAELMGLVTK